MSESTSANNEGLSVAMARRVDEICLRFETACQAAGLAPLPVLENYWTSADDPEGLALLDELIRLDVHYRRLRGESILAEHYRRRFPALDRSFSMHAEKERACVAALAGPGSVDTLSCVTGPDGSITESPTITTFCAEQFGSYELLEELGKGGMGRVYRARQRNTGRVVALKVIRKDLLDGLPAARRTVWLERFRKEARAAAQIDHEHAVTVYEVGEIDGTPYYSMRYVAGRSLAEILRAAPLPGRRAAGYLEPVARAVASAHDRHILHRDLKPHNILVDATDRSYVTDFGLAKWVEIAEEEGITGTGECLGTPSYMAPEQAEDASHATAASDVYSLGATLYALLTGRPPFQAAGVAETLHQLKYQEPVPPRRLNPAIDRDLETIALTCLQKDPARRYPSAGALAEDLRHFLAREPIRARPIGHGERVWRWCRRNPTPALLSMAVILSLVLGTVGATYFAFQAHEREFEAKKSAHDASTNADKANAEWKRADAAARDLRIERDLGLRTLNAAKMKLAQAAWNAGQINRVLGILEEQSPKNTKDDLRGFEYDYLAALCRADLRTLGGFRGETYGVAFSPDGGLMAACAGNRKAGDVKIWNTETWTEKWLFQEHTAAVRGLAFSADGQRLATAGEDEKVRIWDLNSGKAIQTFDGGIGPLSCVAFSPDGKLLAGGNGSWDRSDTANAVAVWDSVTGKIVRALTGYIRPIYRVAFRPGDADTLAIGSEDGVWSWDLAADRKKLLWGTPSGGIAFDSEGKRLVAGGADGVAKVWEAGTWKHLRNLKGHSSSVGAVCFSADGRRLATGSQDQTIRVWDVQNGEEIRVLRGHLGWLTSVAFSPDDKRLASASMDQTVKIWDPDVSQESRVFTGHQNGITGVAFHPNNKALATGSSDNTVQIWDVRSGRSFLALRGHTGAVECLAYDQNGTRLASAGHDRTVRIWDGLSGEPQLTLPGHRDAIFALAFSSDGTRLASGGGEWSRLDKPGELKIWDVRAGRPVLELPLPTAMCGVAFSPDGKLVAGVLQNGNVKLWNAVSGENTVDLGNHTRAARAVAFSPDGKLLATGFEDQTVQLWDTKTGGAIRTLHHATGVLSLAFSPDGKRLATGSFDNPVMVTVWDVESGQETLSLKGPMYQVLGVAFSRDGKRLAAVSHDRTITLWETIPLAERLFIAEPGLSLEWGGAAWVWDTLDAHQAEQTNDPRFLRRTFELSAEVVKAQLQITVDNHYIVYVNGIKIGEDTEWMTVEKYDVAKHLVPGNNVLAILAQNAGGQAGAIARLSVRTADGKDHNIVTDRRTRITQSAAEGWQNVGFDDKDWSPANVLGDAGMAPWNLRQPPWQEESRSEKHGHHWVHGVAVCPNGTNALTADYDGTLRLWELDTGKEIRTFPGHPGGALSVALSPDGSQVLSGGEDGPLRLWDTTSGELIREFEGHRGRVRSVALSGKGWAISAGDADGTLRIWETRTGKALHVIREHQGAVWSVALSPDGTQALSGGEDRTVRLWDVATGKQLRIFEGRLGVLSSLCFAPNNERAAWALDDGTIGVWSTVTGTRLLHATVGAAPVRGIAFSVDGKLLLAGAEDGTLVLRDSRTGQQLGRTLSAFVISLVFTPDGRRVVTAHGDHFARVWHLPFDVGSSLK